MAPVRGFRSKEKGGADGKEGGKRRRTKLVRLVSVRTVNGREAEAIK